MDKVIPLWVRKMEKEMEKLETAQEKIEYMKKFMEEIDGVFIGGDDDEEEEQSSKDNSR